MFVRRMLVDPILVIRDGFARSSDALEGGVDARLRGIGRDREAGVARSRERAVCAQAMELDRLASTDGLTGLPNRSSLERTMDDFRRKHAPASSASTAARPASEVR
ncbi:MAG: hypothetical protein H7A27_07580 [Spirochaetaceae bacterium]|nr:hypothetical protein [Spirochaetaceae bacterium]